MTSSTKWFQAVVGALTAIVTSSFSAAPAAPETKPPVVFNTLSLNSTVSDIYYDLGNRQIKVSAGPTALSTIYKAPDSGSLTFYRLTPPTPPETAPTKVPLASVQLGDNGPYLLLMLRKKPGELSVRVIDNSWDSNPLLSSRVINASTRKTAVKVESDMAEIAPGEMHVFPPPGTPSDILELKIATLDENKWNLRILAPQALYPFTRNTFVIKEQTPSLECPAPDSLDIFTIVDATQPPPPPKPGAQ